MENRKVEITFRTTPLELRMIADQLEQHNAICVNWYHTVFRFENESAAQPAVQADVAPAHTCPDCGRDSEQGGYIDHAPYCRNAA